MSLKLKTSALNWRHSALLRLFIFVAAVTLIVLGSWLSYSRFAHAAGGVFNITVVPQPKQGGAPYQSGEVVMYDIKYECSGQNASDTCDNMFITMARPAGLTTNGTIAGSSETVDHKFVGSTGTWQFLPVIPAGTTGTISVGWLAPKLVVSPSTTHPSNRLQLHQILVSAVQVSGRQL